VKPQLAALLLAGAGVADAALAWPAEVCAGVPLAPAASVDRLDRRLRIEPAAVLAAACAGAPSPEPQLLAAEALLELSRPADADRLLGPLAEGAGAQPPPPWAARWFVVKALRLGAAGQTVEALEVLDRAAGRLRADGLEATRLAFRAHIAQGLHWRRRGEIDRAEAAAAAAQALLAPLGLSVSMEATDLLNLRTLLSYSRQDLEGTLRWARAELEMLERLGQGESADAMSAWSSLGATLSQLGRHPAARAQRSVPSRSCRE
jgi:tetratricopeptide (TPR) repeat protein